MIELTEFRERRASIVKNIAPHKMVRLDEIQQVENNVYEVGNLDLEFTPRAQRQLVRAIGTNSTQLKSVNGLSGDVGQANFSNYLAVAKNMVTEKRVVLIANKNSRVITNIIIPKKDFIPVDDFFDFAEMFIDSTGFEIEKIESSIGNEMDVVLYLQNRNPQIVQFAPQEEFVSNGAYLHWDGKSVEIGNYYVRLVCANGQTQQVRHKDASIFTLREGDVNRLLRVASTDAVMEAGFANFQTKALEAMETQVSLRELGNVHSALIGGRIGLPDEAVSLITGYEANLQRFDARHLVVKGIEKRVKTDVNWWGLYNRMTEFASHSNLLDENDVRRSFIFNYAMELLLGNHDITSYIE